MSHLANRRNFLTASSAIAASGWTGLATAQSAARSANDRIQIAVIGLGSRGFNLIDDLLPRDEARIVAVCDVDRLHYRDRTWGQGPAMGRDAAQQKIAAAYAQRGAASTAAPMACSDFRQLIDDPQVDAVVVATPDHWHAGCTLAALQAGKDVYCEKPVTHFFAEGQQVVAAVARHKAVFQTGSQQRSDWRFRRAVELVRGGHLGNIRQIEIGLPPGYDVPQGDPTVTAVPAGLDYDMWCGPAPRLPYMRARHHRWWRGSRAYGGGVLMDWIGHHNDIAHWAIDAERSGPLNVEAVGWTEPQTEIYDTPVQYTIRCQYAGGIDSTISTGNPEGLKLIGTDGWVFVRRGQLQASDPRLVEPNFQPGASGVAVSDDHMGNFLSCVRSRAECIAPADIGHRSITPGHLSYVAHALGRPLRWDPNQEKIQDDPQADTLLRETNA